MAMFGALAWLLHTAVAVAQGIGRTNRNLRVRHGDSPVTDHPHGQMIAPVHRVRFREPFETSNLWCSMCWHQQKHTIQRRGVRENGKRRRNDTIPHKILWFFFSCRWCHQLHRGNSCWRPRSNGNFSSQFNHFDVIGLRAKFICFFILLHSLSLWFAVATQLFMLVTATGYCCSHTLLHFTCIEHIHVLSQRNG